MSSAIASEAALVRALCLPSFYEFVKEFWSVVVPEKPVWNWHIEYLCNEFQADAERVFKKERRLHDTIVNVSPGSTKSTVLSIMAPAWIHARRQDMRVLCGSHTQALTFELGRKCRMVEESELYRAAFPEMVPAHDQWTKSLFMNTKGGGRMACTVGGMSPTGFHAHFIIIDDPLDPMQAGGKIGAELDAANNFMTEVLPTRKVDKEYAVSWLIMQRLHQNDPTGHLLKKTPEQIRHICLPATRTTKVRPRILRKKYKHAIDPQTGKPDLLQPALMDIHRLPHRVLNEARKTLGEYGYSGQYNQDPVPRGGGMFKPNMIEITPAPLFNDTRWIAICRGWDKAGTSGGGAYTVGFKMGRYRHVGAPRDGSEDEYWILDIIRQQLDSGERERLLKQTAQADGKRVIVGLEQEPGSGGKESAELTVKRLAGWRTRVMIPGSEGSKEDRADAWSSLVNRGAFHMHPGDWNNELLDEMRYFPRSTFKDQVDAGSVAFYGLTSGHKLVGAAF